MEIKDKVIIITGASQGIGLETAKYLAQQGANVVLAARSIELIKKLESEIPNSFAVKTDMSKFEDIQNLVKKTIEKYGKIDILINNAGRGMHGTVENLNLKHYSEIIDLNVHGVIHAMQAVIPQMRKQGKGMIINVSSALTKMYIPGLAAYSSTKYALNALSFIARQELEKDGIIVSVICPKMTETNFMKNSLGTRPNWDSGRKMPEIDKPEYVAKKIAELINSEQAEIVL